MFSTRSAGAAAEELAARHLARQGVRIVERNFRVKGGEIDLIGEQAGVTLFIEVRQRRSSAFGGAAASITAAKQRRLILAARLWLQRHGERPCRFDALLIEGEPPRLEWLQAVFSAD